VDVVKENLLSSSKPRPGAALTHAAPAGAASHHAAPAGATAITEY